MMMHTMLSLDVRMSLLMLNVVQYTWKLRLGICRKNSSSTCAIMGFLHAVIVVASLQNSVLVYDV